jgi:hypothetical protein
LNADFLQYAVNQSNEVISFDELEVPAGQFVLGRIMGDGYTCVYISKTMKKPITLLILSIGISFMSNAQKYLDVNNLKVKISNNLDSLRELGATKHWATKDNNTVVSSALSLWMGGEIDTTIFLSAHLFGQNGTDYYPGPLDTSTGKTTNQRIANYSQVWEITKWEIDQFLATGNISSNIASWPAGSNRPVKVGVESPDMAPFVDVNSDGKYEPENGDYPKMKGDKMLWWVYNTYGVHGETLGPPMSIEIRASAYAYYCDTIQPNGVHAVVNNSLFYEYEYINRGFSSINNFYTGSFADFEAGMFHDDHIGCDSSLNVSYAYNSPTTHLTYNPIVNIKYLGGSVDDSGNPMKLSSATYFENSFHQQNGNPSGPDTQYYNYLKGLTKDGNIHSGTSSHYWNNTDIVSDTNTISADYRSMISTGPFTFEPGTVRKYNIAFIYTNDNSTGAWPVKTVSANRASLKLIQEMYDKDDFQVCRRYLTSINDIDQENKLLRVFPNPTSGDLILKSDILVKDVSLISIVNTLGQKIAQFEPSNNSGTLNEEINLYGHTAGTYIVLIQTNRGTLTEKVHLY